MLFIIIFSNVCTWHPQERESDFFSGMLIAEMQKGVWSTWVSISPRFQVSVFSGLSEDSPTDCFADPQQRLYFFAQSVV